MAQIRNPINPNTTIDLGSVLEVINPQYGRIDQSGLFEEQGILSQAHMYKIVDQGVTKMTKLTSRTERDAMAVEKPKEKYVTMAGVTIKETGGVTVEDLIGVVSGGIDFESDSFQEALIKEATRLANVGAANMEYVKLTATQGVVLDPYDGSVAIDQYANTGTVRSTATITAAPTADLIGSLTALRNQLEVLNGYNGNISEVEIILGETAFNAIVNHPDFVTLYQLAFTGLGMSAINQPVLNGSLGMQQKGQYGYSREFRWENLVFRTYPQKFYRWNGTAVDAVAANKGWTIVHGVSGLYQVKYTPAPYVSKYNQVGQKWVARSTGIIDDTHADITLESHLIPFMQRPEMSLDITVTTA
ncbi:putative major capsid protein [Acinetobacter phage BS46]|nr:putative major capsid protein [Acinetobacter phage BS46]